MSLVQTPVEAGFLRLAIEKFPVRSSIATPIFFFTEVSSRFTEARQLNAVNILHITPRPLLPHAFQFSHSTMYTLTYINYK